MSVRITPDQTTTITVTFEDSNGNPVEVLGNPDWYVISNHSSTYREPKLVDIIPNGTEAQVIPTGLLGTATVVACVYTEEPSPLDPEAFRICKSVDVIITRDSLDASVVMDDTTADDGPGELTGPVPDSLLGGITAGVGETIP